jgi:hypothetical protein
MSRLPAAIRYRTLNEFLMLMIGLTTILSRARRYS